MDRAFDYCFMMRLNETPPREGECYMVEANNSMSNTQMQNIASPTFFRAPDYQASHGAQLFKEALAEETEQDDNEVPGTPPGITYDEDITTVTAAVTVSQIQQLVDCPICIAVEVADEGYTNLKDAADYAYHLNQMRLYKISCDETWDPETGSFNSRPSTPPTEMEIEENCMQIVAMMTPVEDTPAAAAAEASAARSTATTHTLTDQDVNAPG